MKSNLVVHAASVYQPPKLFSVSVGSVGAVATVPLFTVIGSGAVPCPFALNVIVTVSLYLTFNVTYSADKLGFTLYS